MFQFNSNKLIKLCRKLIGMIEDNQIAEELTDKIAGIELKYTTRWQMSNKWKDRVCDMILIFNSQCSPEEKIQIVLLDVEYGNKKIYRVGNRYKNIRKDVFIYEGDSELKAREDFFEFVFETITRHGIIPYFSRESSIVNKYHGEESFNATHA